MRAKDDEAGEDDTEFIEATEDAPVTFESPEEAFDLVSAPISYAIVWPWSQAFWIGRNHRFVAQFFGQFPRFVTFKNAALVQGTAGFLRIRAE